MLYYTPALLLTLTVEGERSLQFKTPIDRITILIGLGLYHVMTLAFSTSACTVALLHWAGGYLLASIEKRNYGTSFQKTSQLVNITTDTGIYPVALTPKQGQ